MLQPPDPVELAQQLIRIPSVNPDDGESAMADFLAGLLESHGFQTESFEFSPKRTSLLARYFGSSDKQPLCLSGHLDTVPPGSLDWSFDPFCGRVENSRLLGRGAVDMKSGLAALVSAACEAVNSPDLKRGLFLVLTADEEAGCKGARELAKEGKLEPCWALLIAEPTSNQPLLGHKGSLPLRLSATGKSAHGSLPELGDNAIYKITRAIEQLRDYDFQGLEDKLFGKPSLSVGLIRGGQRINIVPDSAFCEVDLRILPFQEAEPLIAKLKQLLGSAIKVEIIGLAPPLYTDPSEPFMQLALKQAQNQGLDSSFGAGPYMTDGAYLKPALGNPPTLIMGPGEPGMAHQKDESCPIDQILAARQYYLNLIKACCL